MDNQPFSSTLLPTMVPLPCAIPLPLPPARAAQHEHTNHRRHPSPTPTRQLARLPPPDGRRLSPVFSRRTTAHHLPHLKSFREMGASAVRLSLPKSSMPANGLRCPPYSGSVCSVILNTEACPYRKPPKGPPLVRAPTETITQRPRTTATALPSWQRGPACTPYRTEPRAPYPPCRPRRRRKWTGTLWPPRPTV